MSRSEESALPDLPADLAESRLWPAGLAGALLLAAAWSVWLCRGEIPIRDVALTAHLEAEGPPVALTATVGGRIDALLVRPGQTVRAGDLLLHLDETNTRERLTAENADQTALTAQLAALAREREAAERAVAAAGHAGEAAAAAARGNAAGAAATARAAEDRARRDRQLLAAGLLPAAEAARLAADDETRHTAAGARAADLDRQAWAEAAAAATRRQQLAALDRETARLQGEIAASRAARAALARDLAAHAVRAPAAGRVTTLAPLAPLAVGATIAPGGRLGTLLPAAGRCVVAQLPAAAWERLRPGQPAWIELPARPNTPLAATVVRRAGEIHLGAFTVELACPAARDLPPGLDVRAEIETARTTPAALLWRRLRPR
jgi:multidrug resistance efflux pump